MRSCQTNNLNWGLVDTSAMTLKQYIHAQRIQIIQLKRRMLKLKRDTLRLEQMLKEAKCQTEHLSFRSNQKKKEGLQMFFKTPVVQDMQIRSLGGEFHEALVFAKLGDNDYLVDFNGVKCHAIFNPFTQCYYADDVDAVIESDELLALRRIERNKNLDR